MTETRSIVGSAHELAAAFLGSMRRQYLATMVLARAGDDFPEVLTHRVGRFRQGTAEQSLKSLFNARDWKVDLWIIHGRSARSKNPLPVRDSPGFFRDIRDAFRDFRGF